MSTDVIVGYPLLLENPENTWTIEEKIKFDWNEIVIEFDEFNSIT